MLKNEKIAIEMQKQGKECNRRYISNPICCDNNDLSDMVKKVIAMEFPMLSNNYLLHEMVLYSLNSDIRTVQSIKNVLSYTKGATIKDILFQKGEVLVKCSE